MQAQQKGQRFFHSFDDSKQSGDHADFFLQRFTGTANCRHYLKKLHIEATEMTDTAKQLIALPFRRRSLIRSFVLTRKASVKLHYAHDVPYLTDIGVPISQFIQRQKYDVSSQAVCRS